MKKLVVIVAALAAGAVFAQETPRISRVTLYAGSATVERDVSVAAGNRRVELRCLPASFDSASLRVDGDAGARIGDLVFEAVDAAHATECKRSPFDERIHALEDRRAALEAEGEANDTVIQFLRQPPAASAPAATPLAQAELLRRTALDAYARQQPLKRRLEEIDRELNPLRAERDGAAAKAWRHLRFAVAAEKASTLRVSYQVPSSGWVPAYRASLDSATSMLQIERLAVVAQRSGEDWRGVRLKLSTGQPGAAVRGPVPSSWQLSIAAPEERQRPLAMANAAMALAAAPAPAREASPDFDATVFQGSYATEFDLPGSVDLPADGQKITLQLERIALPASVRVRATPRLDSTAYVVAEAARPAGVWPSGNLQLVRDGAFAGSQEWRPASDEGFLLPFGRDDRVRISVERPAEMTASSGFIGGRAERRLRSLYSVLNQHATPVQLEILEAQPVSSHEEIRVQSSFVPRPTVEGWNKQPGVVAWLLPLAAGATLMLSADYTISWPKDVRNNGLR